MTSMDVDYDMGDAAVAEDTAAMILCCLCGAKIRSNPSNMCANCLRGQVDITTGISKQVSLFWCRGCGRYQKPPWVSAELESRELLALCLKKIKGLNKDVKLIDAGFVWTEPNSRRIKVKATIQKDVYNTIMQQTFIVEFVVTNLQCTDCQKSYTEHTWNTVVQLRQKVRHKRTFYWLEQLLLKHNVCEKTLNVKEQPEGLDFYWGHKNQAVHMLNFLQAVVPIRFHTAKRLISEDIQSNVKNYKFTYAVELVPICKDDLVLISPKLAAASGGCSPLLVCVKVSACLHLVDPLTLKRVDVNADKYWRNPFNTLMNSRQLTEFTVLDVRKQSPNSVNPNILGHPTKFALADVTVARSADFGSNDVQFEVTTHLGNLLKVGDTVLGYDLTAANAAETAQIALKSRELPDIILIRKTYPARTNRARTRAYKLRQLPKEQGDAPRKNEAKREEAEYEEFLKDIDEDPELRAQINLYKRDGVSVPDVQMVSVTAAGPASASAPADADDMDMKEDDGFPAVQLDELLDDLAITDNVDEALEQPGVAVDAEVNELDDTVLANVTASLPSKPAPGAADD